MPIRVQSRALSTYPDASLGSPLDQNIAVDLNERQAVILRGIKTAVTVFWCIFLAGKERKTMMASQFSDAQEAFNLKKGDGGVWVAEICLSGSITSSIRGRCFGREPRLIACGLAILLTLPR